MADLIAPAWLDESFLTQVVQQVEEDKDVKISKWTCEFAVPPGSNWLGDLFRLRVHYETEADSNTISLITKTPLENGVMKTLGERLNAYEKEFKVYREVIPRMEELHTWSGAARSFLCPVDNCLVLEDLREQGYRMADRLKQLDVDHCRQFFLSLSWLHALTVAVHHSHPDLITSVGKNGYCSGEELKRAKEEGQMKFFLMSMISTMKRLKGCERYVEMLSRRVDSFFDKMLEVYSPNDGLNVLNHGDTWTNNILFKYNDCGEVVEAKMIDFQLAKFCSFAHDIIYFWFTSATVKVRELHREEMFELYRENLNRALEQLNCHERLSKEEFDRQMKASSPFAFHAISQFMPFIMADPDDIEDLSDMNFDEFSKPFDDNSEQLSVFRSKYYETALPKALQHAEELGAFYDDL